MCWRCFAAPCPAPYPRRASTGSPTDSPKSSPSQRISAHAELGQDWPVKRVITGASGTEQVYEMANPCSCGWQPRRMMPAPQVLVTPRAGPRRAPAAQLSGSGYSVEIGEANRAGDERLNRRMKHLNRPYGYSDLVNRRAAALPRAFSETGQPPSAAKFAILVLRTKCDRS